MSTKGGIGYDVKSKRYYVSWYHDGKTRKIWYYNGFRLESKDMAERLRSVMRGDHERGVFRIEKYLSRESEVSPLIETWLSTVISRKAPSTQETYRSQLTRHVIPFLNERRASLNEIDYSLLMELNFALELSESSKRVLFRILKSFLEFCKKTGKLESMPVFPGHDDFVAEPKDIIWIPEERQIRIIEAIPVEHQPIYWFLKYHMRRPAEACALLKSDLNKDVFTIQRTFSADKLHITTKHKRITKVPLVEAFKPVLEAMRRDEWYLSSPFLFVNPEARNKERYYTVQGLRERWKTAAKSVGETIGLYKGLKHSSASQLINEYGMNKFDVQVALDCSANTVNSYASAEVSARKAILDKAFKRKIRKVD